MKNNNFLKFALVNKELVPFEKANISIATQALHYGTAAFGGMRVKVTTSGKKKSAIIFRLDEHCKRLVNSAKMLNCDPEIWTVKYFEKSILDFIKKNDYIDTDYYIRPLIYISDLGLSPNLNANKSLLIYGVELGDYLSNNGVNVCVSSYRRQEDNMIPGRGKISGSYYISSAAKAEALDRGFDEAILLNMSGKVSEGSAMNIFMVRDSTLYTTLGTDNILEGITRRSIIEIANLLKIKFIERQIDISELMYVAEEVFFSGTAAKMTMVNKIEGKAVSKERVIFNKINKELENVFAGKSVLSKKWITKIAL